ARARPRDLVSRLHVHRQRAWRLLGTEPGLRGADSLAIADVLCLLWRRFRQGGYMSTQTKQKGVGDKSAGGATMSVRPRDRFTPPEKADVAHVGDASPVFETAVDCGGGAHLRAISQRDTTLRRMLALIDVLMVYAALTFVLYVLRLDTASLAAPSVLIAPSVVLAAKAVGLYDRDQHTVRKTTIDELPSILYLSVLSSIV